MSQRGEKAILVVDDNEDVRRLVRKVLESAGHRVMEANTGEEALQLADELTPALVLMDVRLPGAFDGLETTRRLKGDERLSQVPVVALTASVLERDRQQALSAGCVGFIGKPIDITRLTTMVEGYMSNTGVQLGGSER